MKNLTKQSPTNRTIVARAWQSKWLFIGIAVALSVVAIAQVLPGGWGIRGDAESTVITIEKDPQGDIVSQTTAISTRPLDKSLWDLLTLIGVPLAIAGFGFWFKKSQQEQAERFARQQKEQEADETREEVLQLYFDRISTLLIDKNLMAIASKGNHASPESKELLEASLDVIRARTLSILKRFEKDIDRKSSAIRFLAEAEIISKLKLNLTGANLYEANLTGADLNKANLYEANLTGANLTGANLYEANLTGANLTGAILYEANLYRANLTGANLYKANLYKANLEKTVLYEANLMMANLIGVKLYGAKLYEADLEGANLHGANLNKANLTEANLEGAILYEANLNKANLTEANLNKANLTGANLYGANLNKANLTEANLMMANLTGADLEGANLYGANLYGVNLKNISSTTKTIWPTREKMAGAQNISIELQQQLGPIPKSPPPRASGVKLPPL